MVVLMVSAVICVLMILQNFDKFGWIGAVPGAVLFVATIALLGDSGHVDPLIPVYVDPSF